MNTTQEHTAAALDGTIGKATAKAHDTVDRVAASVGPLVDRVTSMASDTTATLQSKAEDLMHTRDQWMDDVRGYVRERPFTALGVTAAAVYLISRLWTR